MEDTNVNIENRVELGIVTGCLSLNVREEPKPDASILGTINSLSEVMLDSKESTDEYYKICTVSGIEGFCAKKYITIKQ
jgi:uncharacterized protein YgiM (DUF1202 family)